MRSLFISYASADQAIAMEVCALLEARGVSCWIAPRDVAAGTKWDEAIVGAIRDARAFLLVLTHAANESAYVSNEVNHAFAANKSIFTFRAEEVTPGKSLEFYLARHHWTDGFAGKIEVQVAQLATSVTTMLGAAEGVGVATQPASKIVAPARVVTRSQRAARRERLAWVIAAGAVIVAAALAVSAVRAPRVEPAGRIAASIDAPPGTVLGEGIGVPQLPIRTPMLFTPDGTALVIEASADGKSQLYLRPLDRGDARAIAGTEGARTPFASPDGRWIGFWAGNELRKVPIEGGAPTAIVPLQGPLGPNGASWGRDDTIVFGDSTTGRLMRVSANGGTATPLTSVPTSRRHLTPMVLPEANGVLFSDVALQDATDSRLMFQPLGGGAPRLLIEHATDPRLMPSGRLGFMRLGTLMTVGFDAARGTVSGDPVPVMSGVMESGIQARFGAGSGLGMFAVSPQGTLAVIRGALIGARETGASWVGGAESASAEPAAGRPAGGRLVLRASPDGSHIGMTLVSALRREFWVIDVQRGLWMRCEECDSDLIYFAWAPDGRSIAGDHGDRIVTRALDRSSAPRTLVQEPNRTLATVAWLTDGRLAYLSMSNAVGFNGELKLLEADGKNTRTLLPATANIDADVSRDGRWIAYTAANNVFVQALDGSPARVQVAASGLNPMWSRDGRTLYYAITQPPQTTLMAVDVTGSDRPIVGAPREVLRRPDPQVCFPMRCYDVAADGRRFLMRTEMQPGARPSVTQMDLVLNWAEGAK